VKDRLASVPVALARLLQEQLVKNGGIGTKSPASMPFG
jgi:hypothetical protein